MRARRDSEFYSRQVTAPIDSHVTTERMDNVCCDVFLWPRIEKSSVDRAVAR